MQSLCERTHPRRKSYDYHLPGSYFVTAITYRRTPLFGRLNPYGVTLSNEGRIVEHSWRAVPSRFDGVTMDALVVMPDHVHAIVVLSATETRTAALSVVVGWAKRLASRSIRQADAKAPSRIWQRSFHDRIIRDAAHFHQTRLYIWNNPARAAHDLSR